MKVSVAATALLAGAGFTTIAATVAGIGWSALYIWLTCSIGALVLAVDAMAKVARPARIVFCLYFVLFFGVPGLFHLDQGYFPFYSMRYSDATLLTASGISATYVLLALAAYQCVDGARIETGQPRDSYFSSEGAQLRAASACLLAAAAAGSIAGWGAVLETRADQYGEQSLATYLLITLARLLSFLALVFSLKGWKSVPHRFGTTFLCLMLFFAANSPLAVPRFLLGSYLITLYCLYGGFWKHSRLVFVIAVTASIFTLFPFLSAISRGDVRELMGKGLIGEFMTSGDFDGLQSTANVVEMVGENGPSYGVKLLSAALVFVPRSIWPEKSRGTGYDAAEFAGYEFKNISSPIQSEFYADFGFAGVIVGALITGWGLAFLDKTHDAKARVTERRLLSVALLIGFMTILLRGPLVGVVGPVALSVALGAVCTSFGRTQFRWRG